MTYTIWVYHIYVNSKKNLLQKIYLFIYWQLKVEYISQSKSMEVSVDDFTERITFSIFTTKNSDSFRLEFEGQKLEDRELNYRESDVMVLSYPVLRVRHLLYKYKISQLLELLLICYNYINLFLYYFAGWTLHFRL